MTDRGLQFPAVLAAAATVATFAKSFIPFYLVGSTAIFAIACLIAATLLVLNWLQVLDRAVRIRAIILVIGLLYAIVVTSFFIKSYHQVPTTYLLGILIFHGLFLLFGFASASATTTVLVILLLQGTVYLAAYGSYMFRYGDFVRGGTVQDVFGIGAELAQLIHQPIGLQVALAALAAIALASGRARLAAYAFLMCAIVFVYRVQARTALIALSCGLALLVFGAVYARRKGLAMVVLASAIVLAGSASFAVFQYALHATIDPKATDAISRTLLEIQERPPDKRLAIWTRSWNRLTSNIDGLIIGRGVGSFPVDEGFGPPDWPLRKTEGAKHYPHNIHLEVLYETGIAGMLAFSIVVFFPIVVALNYWRRLSLNEKVLSSIYMFYLTSMELSGSFGISYDFQFFLGIALGIASLKLGNTGTLDRDPETESLRPIA